MSADMPNPPKGRGRRQAVRFAVSLVTGMASGFAMGLLAKALGVRRGDLSPADIAAQMLATIFVAAGAYLLVLAADRRRLARALECDADLPASDEEAGQFRAQAAALIGAGALLAIPYLLGVFARTRPQAGAALLALALALLIGQSWLNWRLLRGMDEFMRRAFFSAAAVAFAAGQAALLAWGAAERLVSAPPLSAWSAGVLLTLLYVLASAGAAVRGRLAGRPS